MTVELVVLYTQPDDPDVFERHYAETHMPMVHRIPGLARAEAGRFIAEADGGDPTLYRLASSTSRTGRRWMRPSRPRRLRPRRRTTRRSPPRLPMLVQEV